jgi:hypothetical protein
VTVDFAFERIFSLVASIAASERSWSLRDTVYSYLKSEIFSGYHPLDSQQPVNLVDAQMKWLGEKF